MGNNTAQKILDVAQEMVRNRGYSAFSYADISGQVGIRKASIHYHFPCKDDLVKTLVQRYRDVMKRLCDGISQSGASPKAQLMQFATLYRNGLDQQQICLCSMLTADFEVLSESVQAELRAYFQDIETWLVSLLLQGYNAGDWQCPIPAEQEAKAIMAMLQGAQLLARSQQDCGKAFEQIAYPMLAAK